MLVVLLGPTGVGKTELSLRIAEKLNTCILSADSRQMYADLRIGTAAPTAEQLARVTHHFVGQLRLTDSYSAAQYEAEAMALLDRIFTRRPVALLTGGSMMYIDAVCRGLDDIPSVDPEIRARLSGRLQTEGLEPLVAELQQLDPVYSREVDPHNPRRVVHALELCHATGRPYSSFRRNRPRPRPFRILKIGLNRPRAELYERINLRVEQMMADGLEQEARRVYPYRELNALNTVGYKEMFRYIDGEWTREQAVEMIKQNTRHYAKRQLTWFRRDADIRWFHPEQETAIMSLISERLEADGDVRG